MSDKKKTAGFAAAVVAGLIVGGGASATLTAQADSSVTPNATPSASATAGATSASDPQGPEDHEGRGRGGRMMGTEVTGSELAQVTEAVKSKDSAFTVERVMKDPQGTYHVMGTKSGSRAGYEVSKDLKTVTAHQPGERGGKGGPGGPGGHSHSAATAEETAKVKAAVKAQDSAVAVDSVRKDPDGSYDAMGTRSGNKVMVEVSKDLKTVDVRTGGPGGR